MSRLGKFSKGCLCQLRMTLVDDVMQTAVRINSVAPQYRLASLTCRTLATRTSTAVEKDLHEPSTVRPFSEVPGPKGLPFVGTLFEFLKKDGPKLTKIFELQRQRHVEYGEIFRERIGAVESVLVSNPWEYSKVIRAEGKYPRRITLDAFAKYKLSRGRSIGVVNAQGEEWFAQRSAVSKKILKPLEVAKFADQMVEVADDFMVLLASERDDVGELPDLKLLLFRWTMESVSTFVFEERLGCLGTNPSPAAQAFANNVLGSISIINSLYYRLPIYKIYPTKEYRKLVANQDKIYEFGRLLVQKKLEDLESGTAASGYFEFLLDRDNADVDQITNLSLDLLNGAIETVTALTSWCLYKLAMNPQAQARMHEEIQQFKVKTGGHLTGQDIIKLPYVKAVVKETLRAVPVVYCTSRILQDDLELCGYNIPAGTHVQGNLYTMYHNPDLFPNPEEFLPERWLTSGNMSQTVKSLSQLAWGHGPRMCLGRRIAEQEVHIVLTKIVEKFELSYHHEDIEPLFNLIMVPDRPVYIRLTPRDN